MSSRLYRHAALELERTNEELALFAATDPQSGFKNQRGFDEAWKAAVGQAKTDGLPLALIRLEIDHLDSMISGVEPVSKGELIDVISNRLRQVSRDCDIAARLGEHGFALILPGLTAESALRVAEELQELIRAARWGKYAVTASMGVASMTPRLQAVEPATFLCMVESALAGARLQGGDRVVESEIPLPQACFA